MPLAIVSLFLVILVTPKALADDPSVTLMNAAKPGIKMPVAGIGTAGYVVKDWK